jgi:general secretion pathway protein A
MYNEFYGLSKNPFNMTADPAFLYLTAQHREALAGLAYAILGRKGLLVLSGMAGSGKTTLLTWLLQKLPNSQVQSSVILNPTLTRDEFLELAMLDFGIPDIPASKARRLWALQEFLLKSRGEGKLCVLIIDEAHKLSSELLEEIRLLGNLECADEKLIQLVLIGQNEIDAVLGQPGLWQLKQRVSVRLSLVPLQVEEVAPYIQHRWCVAGGRNPAPFTSAAVTNVATWSKGIPRLINSICDNALVLAMACQESSVNADHIESVARDLLLIERASPLPVAMEAPDTPAAAPPIPMKTVDSHEAKPVGKPPLARWASRLGIGN